MLKSKKLFMLFLYIYIYILDGSFDSNTLYGATFRTGQRGCRVLMVDNFSYNRNRQTDDKTYWICSRKVSNR